MGVFCMWFYVVPEKGLTPYQQSQLTNDYTGSYGNSLRGSYGITIGQPTDIHQRDLNMAQNI